jgi:hypothetical protein
MLRCWKRLHKVCLFLLKHRYLGENGFYSTTGWNFAEVSSPKFAAEVKTVPSEAVSGHSFSCGTENRALRDGIKA